MCETPGIGRIFATRWIILDLGTWPRYSDTEFPASIVIIYSMGLSWRKNKICIAATIFIDNYICAFRASGSFTLELYLRRCDGYK
jgi:hypothetical protein